MAPPNRRLNRHLGFSGLLTTLGAEAETGSGRNIKMLSDVIKPDLHWKTRLLSPCSLVLQGPVAKSSAGPCSHQGRAPVTSARNGSLYARCLGD